MAERQFWQIKTLDEMSAAEWESRCDRCGKCCLVRLQDIDSGDYFTTKACCDLLDVETSRCTRYFKRHDLVTDCVKLSYANINNLEWMPTTCAYRLLAEGKELYDWHPLVSGDIDSVHKVGISVRSRVVPQDEIEEEDLPDYIVNWFD